MEIDQRDIFAASAMSALLQIRHQMLQDGEAFQHLRREWTDEKIVEKSFELAELMTARSNKGFVNVKLES